VQRSAQTTRPAGARSVLFKGLASLVVFLAFLLVLELGLRFVDLAKGRGLDWRGRDRIHNQKPLVPFRTFGFDPYASDGAGGLAISSRWDERYPLEQAPDTYRIVCFGGSTTENRQRRRR